MQTIWPNFFLKRNADQRNPLSHCARQADPFSLHDSKCGNDFRITCRVPLDILERVCEYIYIFFSLPSLPAGAVSWICWFLRESYFSVPLTLAFPLLSFRSFLSFSFFTSLLKIIQWPIHFPITSAFLSIFPFLKLYLLVFHNLQADVDA